jgi:hypothetical protein
MQIAFFDAANHYSRVSLLVTAAKVWREQQPAICRECLSGECNLPLNGDKDR